MYIGKITIDNPSMNVFYNLENKFTDELRAGAFFTTYGYFVGELENLGSYSLDKKGGYLMKMDTNSVVYSAETSIPFTIAYTAVSTFTTTTLTTALNNIKRSTTGSNFITAITTITTLTDITTAWKDMTFDTDETGYAVITALCHNLVPASIVITAPTLSDQTYDLVSPVTPSSCTLPPFTVTPKGQTITYTNVATNLPAWITFDPKSITYDWS